MKINWGTGIIIAMTLFIGFIMYFVVQMVTNSKYDSEMVTENYYQKEYVFQQEIDAMQNANTLENNVSVYKEKESFSINFPKEFDYKGISGTIHMYRPSDKNLDIEIPIQLNSSRYDIPYAQLAEGRWQINITWEYQNIPYLYKKILHN